MMRGIVVAFILLSLTITATGTARFALAMGYGEWAGYLTGGAFDLAKAILPLTLLSLKNGRSYLALVLLGLAWLGLVTYSALATHATVATAIAAIERTGTWQMQTRTGIEAELASVEQQMAVLATPRAPRPAKTVREALAAERVPSGIWRGSQECLSIRDSNYFQRACGRVLELRRELAAAGDYERLAQRAQDLRQSLAAAPIVATSDPLPQAFESTLGRVLPLDGRAGVALLLTGVVEIMSCFGLAAIRLARDGAEGRDADAEGRAGEIQEGTVRPPRARLPVGDLPGPCTAQTTKGRPGDDPLRRDRSSTPPSTTTPLSGERRKRENRQTSLPSPRTSLPSRGTSLGRANVSAFVKTCVPSVAGASVGASELYAAYKAWCQSHAHEPVSAQQFGVELRGLGFTKWKTSGLIRYRDRRHDM